MLITDMFFKENFIKYRKNSLFIKYKILKNSTKSNIK